MPCLHPLSPPYSLLPRLHTYLLLLLVLPPIPFPWPFHLLSAAALATLTARTAVAAIHAFALLAIVRRESEAERGGRGQGVYDADVFGIWALLAPVAIAMCLLLAVERGKTKPVLRVWGVLVCAGTVGSYVALRLSRRHFAGEREVERVCEDGGTLRRGQHSVFVEGDAVFGMGFDDVADKIAPAVMVCVAVGVWGCFKVARYGRSDTNVKPARGIGPETQPTDLIAPSKPPRRILNSGLRLLNHTILFVSPILLIATVVLNEIYLMSPKGIGPGIPTMEKPDAVGQWGVWVATGVVVGGAVVGWVVERMGGRGPGGGEIGGREADGVRIEDDVGRTWWRREEGVVVR